MLQLYTKNKEKIAGLTRYKDLCIESVVLTGDKTLSFSYPSKWCGDIEFEGYLRTRTDEFVIKEIQDQGLYKTIKATLNVEDMEGQSWDRFDSTGQNITNCLNLALVGTGWTVGSCNITKERTVRKTLCSTWEIVQEIRKTYRCEMHFDTINKRINIAEKLGTDKGCYFIDSLNLKSLDIQGNSYDYYTKLIAFGKDDISIVVENYQYSNKIKTISWKDERYTDIVSLAEDAILRLNEISKPYIAYGATVVDLANMNERYKDILSYSLGDTITLISNNKNVKEKQRIVKLVEYPDDPSKNTCELANTTLRFEDIQKEQQDTTDTVNNITSDNGTISESAIKTTVASLVVNKADIQSLNAVTARIGTLEVTTATITQLNATNANITNLQANKANITDLTAANAKINTLEVKAATIDTLVAGNISAENIKAGSITAIKIATGAITAGSAIIAQNAIGSAQISDLDVSKVSAGDISTVKFRVIGSNGKLTIQDNRLQIFDTNNGQPFERICIGDVNHDNTIFGMRIRGSNGTTILFDENGQTKEGFTDGYGKLVDNSLDPKKIDIEKAVIRINGATTLIQSSKVSVSNTSLDVAFSNISTTVASQGSTITTNTANITANTNTIALKLDTQTYNTYKATNDNNITIINSNLSTQSSGISVLQGQIISKVSQTDINNSINAIQVGGRNLVLGSKTLSGASWISGGSYTLPVDSDGLTYFQSVSNGSEHFLACAPINALPNSQYTISVKAKATGLNVGICVPIYYNGVWQHYDLFEKDTGEIWISKTFIITTNSSGGIIRVALDNYRNTTGTVYYKALKVEEGNKATTWSQAPEDIQGQIDSATTRISTAESTIIQNTNSIALKVSQTEVNTSINAIQIGGRNYIRNSGVATTIVSPSSGYNHYDWGATTPEQNVLTGVVKTYTVSFMYTPNTNKVMPFTSIVVGGTSAGDAWSERVYYSSLNVKPHDGSKYIYTQTFVISGNIGKYISHLLMFMCENNNAGCTIHQLKLEEGSKATTWTPAPEDIQGQIDTATTRLSTAESTITQHTTSIALKVATSEYTSYQTTVSNSFGTTNSNVTALTTRVATTESSISILQNQIISKVSQTDINNSINAIQIGGRNLIPDSKISTTSSEYGFGSRTLVIDFIAGQTYTFAVNGKIDDQALTDGKSLACCVYDDTWSHVYNYFLINSTTDVTKSITFTSGWSGRCRVSFYLFASGGSRLGKATVNWATLVLGTKALTDYTPSPEDIQGQIDTTTTRISTAESTITQQANQITSKVSQTEVNNSVNAIQVGGRNLLTGTKDFSTGWVSANSWLTGTTYMGLSIYQVNNAWCYYYQNYNFELGKTYTLSAWVKTNIDNAIPVGLFSFYGSGEHYINIPKANTWYRWSYTFTIDGSVHPAGGRTVRVESGSISGTNPLFVCGMKLEESTKATDWTPAPEDTQGQIDSATTRISTAESTITQHANQIALKVEVNGVKSIIEQNPASVQIGFNGINPKIQVTSSAFTIYGGFYKTFEFIGNQMKLYDYTNGSYLGYYGMVTWTGTSNQGLSVNLNSSSFIEFGKYDNTTGMYLANLSINCGGIPNNYIGIGVHENMYIYGTQLTFKANSISGVGNYGSLKMMSNVLLMTIPTANSGEGLLIQSNSGTNLFQILAGQTYTVLSNASMAVNGNFTVSGAKNRAVRTNSYATRGMNSYETCECYFGDMGNDVIVNGECKITLDPIFLETINSNIPYNVFITKYAQGDIWVEERAPGYFIVKGDNIPFSWEIKAKQKEYEDHRLEILDVPM